MVLIACKWLTAEVIALAKSGKGIRRRRGGDFPTQNSFQALNNEIFEVARRLAAAIFVRSTMLSDKSTVISINNKIWFYLKL